MTLRDFLNWFEGFSENIEGAPNAKQWERIRTRLLALKDAAPELIASEESQSTEPVGGAVTTAWWKGQVKAALEEQGYDPESADEVLATIPVDLNAEPQAIAARAAQGM